MVWRIFGAPFDPLDRPEKVELQRAYLLAVQKGVLPATHPLDPYDLILDCLPPDFIGSQAQPLDKFPIPGWLRPRPLIEDLPSLKPMHFTAFLDSGGCEEMTLDLKEYVSRRVFPDSPLMVGVDHCLTGGILMALAERLGPEKYSVLLLDSHFDGIPLKIRRQAGLRALSHDPTVTSPFICGDNAPGEFSHYVESYCCGNFLNYLLMQGTMLPEYTFVVGVTDYPFYNDSSCMDPRQELYKKSYEGFQRMGVTFIPGGEYEPLLLGRLQEVLNSISTPWVYLSIDADIGARNALYAARFLDRRGLSAATIGHIFDLIGRYIRMGAFQLVGVDIMEIDVHLAGVTLPTGIVDQTAQFFGREFQKLFCRS